MPPPSQSLDDAFNAEPDLDKAFDAEGSSIVPTPTQAAPAREQMHPFASLLRGAAQGISSDWHDELVGLAFGEEEKRLTREANRAAQADNPRWYGAGEIVGGMAQSLSPLGKRTFLGAPGWRSALASGALAGAGSSEDESAAGITGDAAIGALMGMAGGKLGSLAGAGIGRATSAAGRGLKRVAEGIVKPSDAAAALEAKGVTGLTLGQLNPAGALNQLEEAATEVGGFGPQLREAREQAMANWQARAILEGLPPGATPPDPALGVPEQLQHVYEGFSGAYNPARAPDIQPYVTELVPGRIAPGGEPLNRVVALPQGFERAISSNAIVASDANRKAVGRVLQDMLTKVPESVYEPGGRINAGAVLDLRQQIRERLRNLRTGSPDTSAREQAEVWSQAEDYLTQVLERQLPSDVVENLRAADSAYRTYKVLEDAARRSAQPSGGFSPAMVSRAMKAAEDSSAFTRGVAGGRLREMTDPAREVFEMRAPRTAVRSMAAGRIGQWVNAPAMVALNTPSGQAIMRGTTGFQRRLAGSEWLKNLAASEPQTLGKWGEMFARAAARGEDSVTMLDFTLSQTDPEYRAMKQKLAEAEGLKGVAQ